MKTHGANSFLRMMYRFRLMHLMVPILQLTLVPPSNSASCGTAFGAPDVLSFELNEYADVTISLQSESGQNSIPRIVSLRKACDDIESELGCAQGATFEDYVLSILHQDAITYWSSVPLWSSPVQLSITLTSRKAECNDGVDNDADERIDLNDPRCIFGEDQSELNDPSIELPACADGEDNDEDTLIGHPNDPDCRVAGKQEQTLCVNFTPIELTQACLVIKFY